MSDVALEYWCRMDGKTHDVECGKGDRISLELTGFDGGDDEYRDRQPPKIMAKLGPQLEADKVRPSPCWTL